MWFVCLVCLFVCLFRLFGQFCLCVCMRLYVCVCVVCGLIIVLFLCLSIGLVVGVSLFLCYDVVRSVVDLWVSLSVLSERCLLVGCFVACNGSAVTQRNHVCTTVQPGWRVIIGVL